MFFPLRSCVLPDKTMTSTRMVYPLTSFHLLKTTSCVSNYYFFKRRITNAEILFFFFVYLFILRERESQAGSAHEVSAQGLTQDSNPQNREIVTWAKIQELDVKPTEAPRRPSEIFSSLYRPSCLRLNFSFFFFFFNFFF